MQRDIHKIIETVFNATKIAAIIIAGAWTYYQWDRVFFPKESAEQVARESNLRTDMKMAFEAVQIQGLGKLFESVSHDSGAEDGSSTEVNVADEIHFVEISGLISMENTRPFPIALSVSAVSLEMQTEIQIDPSAEIQAIHYGASESIDLAGDYVFGDIISGGFIVESGGVARLAFRAPVALKGSLLAQPHEYVFGATFDLAAVGDLENLPTDGRSKSKQVLSSILVNGPAEAGLAGTTGAEAATLPRAATRIDFEELRSGSILGGSSSIIRKPLGDAGDIIKW